MFNDILKELREDHNLTQEELAKRFQVHKSAISKYEVGEREPNLDFLLKVSSFFDVSIDYLLGKTKISSSYYNDKQLDKLSEESISELNYLLSKFTEDESLIKFTYQVLKASEILKKHK